MSSIGRRSCEIITGEKYPCHTKFCAFRCLISGPQNLILGSRNQILGKFYFFIENYVTSEGAVSHWSSKLRDNSERKKHPRNTKFCAFRCWISGPQNLILRSRNEILGKFLLSRTLRYFRGSRFSQCCILYQQLPITHYQVRFYANNYFE